jgi:hypothetical protein
MKLGAFAALFCLGTLVTGMVLTGYFWSKGGLTKERLHKILSIAQGIDIEESPSAAPAKAEPPTQEFPSFEEIEHARSLKMRNLELREQVVADSLEKIRFEQRKLQDDKDRIESQHKTFTDQLAALEKGALASGRDQVRLVWENIKPKLAKELILEMIAKGEKDDVVTILSAMPIGKRAKIVSEFKTEQEFAKLGEILRLIREGIPEEPIIEKTRDQLNKFNPNGT